MSRIRAQAPIDEDAVSPTSIAAALAYVANSINEQAEAAKTALDWNSFKIYTRRSSGKKALLITGWADVL